MCIRDSVHEAYIAAGATAVFAKEDAMALRDHLLAAATSASVGR